MVEPTPHYSLLSKDLFLMEDKSFLSFREREFKGKRRLISVYRIRHFPLQHLPTLPLLVERWLAIRRAACTFDAQFLSAPLFLIQDKSIQISTRALASWFHTCLAQISVPAKSTHLPPHSLRKGAATKMFAVGIPPKQIRWWVG